ncbi:MAG: carotenoid biosynthesis protein [Chloroflexota bacterium]|nr:carotenoid biosynthesis protein [Dehalococcoidia bacterium]MDW8254506.1 carotenoid biosynthesis protein [Chloroflexota bacterium]
MKLVFGLYLAHVAALLFGLIGMLVMVPNPQLWSDSPLGVQTFAFSMQYLGAMHIWFGAAAMFVFGWQRVGRARTVVFFAAATLLSLSFELAGTGLGIPFGPYSYTGGLGWMVLDLVPYTIPLSWFYLGFAAYLIGTAIVTRYGWRPAGPLAIVLGVWLLTAWDLVLDPAMAYDELPLKFWVWHESGPYYGMPLRNLLGWMLTGVTFMTVARLAWRSNATDVSPAVPLLVYSTNLVWAMILCLSAGLWPPVVLATVLGLLPPLLLLRPRLALRLAHPISEGERRPSRVS